MVQKWNSWYWQLGLASYFAIFAANAFFGNCVLAQSNITPDNTLGNERSVVLPNFSGTSDEVIIGGAQREVNLFHSFLEFNISEGRRAYFYSPSADIQNILARVTGGNQSKIMGLLGTYGESQPNLFLINPNGIIFGPNARLDVGGSFVASTAKSMLFGDRTQFSADAPQSTPLLTVSVPTGLQFGDTAGDISVQGAFLGVQPGKTLALVGGNLGLEGGYLNAEGGRIELSSLNGNSLVSLNPTEGWTLGYKDAQNLLDIQLSQQTIVNASGEGGGDIQVQGGRITLTDGSRIVANTLGSQNSGGISIQVLDLIVQKGSFISATTSGTGQGGNLDVTASNSVKLSGTSADGKFPSGLFAQTRGNGAAGNLKIATGQLLVEKGAVVSASSTPTTTGQAGDLDVTASESIKLSGTSADGAFLSGLFAQAEGSGAAGNLKIATGQLLVEKGAVVSASSTQTATGQAGDLDVTASESIKLSGTSAGTSADGQPLRVSGLFAEALGGGAAGNLKIATGQLLVQDRAAVSAITSSGQGGNITLQPKDLLLLRGGSQISTTAGTAGTAGNGGNITINTDLLVALEHSGIKAEASKGRGGNIQIKTQGLFPSQDSEISASSERGINGVVEINRPEIEASRGLVTLPVEIVNVAGLIAQGCSAGGGQGASKFIVTGRGGLPPTPRETLNSDTVLEDWGILPLAPNETLATGQSDRQGERQPNQPENPLNTPANSMASTRSTPAPIVEAQGWVIDANGEVVLTAQAPNVTPNNPWLTSANCHKG